MQIQEENGLVRYQIIGSLVTRANRRGFGVKSFTRQKSGLSRHQKCVIDSLLPNLYHHTANEILTDGVDFVCPDLFILLMLTL